MQCLEKYRALITQIPKVQLANLPTPLMEMPRLSKMLGGPRIWIKRDDSTGLSFGGSKVRSLEYTLADAINKGANTIVTVGDAQSNHGRLATAAARKLGLKAVLVLATYAKPKKYEGNLRLCSILGADIRFTTWHKHGKMVAQTIKEVSDKGDIPYFLPWGGTTPIGIIGHINTAIELQTQANDIGFRIGDIIHASTSGGLQIGLTLGNKMMRTDARVSGIVAILNGRETILQNYMLMTNDICRILNIDLTWKAEDLSFTNFYSEGIDNKRADHQKITNAIELIARTEGIILDPTYSGKAMAILIDMVKQKRFNKEDNIIFIHTGGTPALFVQQRMYLLPIYSNAIRLYKKYGKKYRLMRWLRNTLPING